MFKCSKLLSNDTKQNVMNSTLARTNEDYTHSCVSSWMFVYSLHLSVRNMTEAVLIFQLFNI